MPTQGIFSKTGLAALDAKHTILQARQAAELSAMNIRLAAEKEANDNFHWAFEQDAKNTKAFEERLGTVTSAIDKMTPDKVGQYYQALQRIKQDFPDKDLGIFEPGAFASRYGLDAGTSSPRPPANGTPQLEASPGAPAGGKSSPRTAGMPAAPGRPAVAYPDTATVTSRLDGRFHGRVKNFDATTKTYAPLAEKWGAEYDIPPLQLLALTQIESAGDDTVGANHKGATGPLQITQVAKDQVGMSDADVNDKNVAMEVAAKYFRYLLDRFDDDQDKAIAAYNWGEGNVKRKWDSGNLPQETRDYLDLYHAITGASTTPADRNHAVEVLSKYPAWMQEGYGNEQLWMDAQHGHDLYGTGIRIMRDMASRTVGYGSWEDVMADQKLYSVARAALAVTLDKAHRSSEEISRVLDQFDKNAQLMWGGATKEEAKMKMNEDWVADQVDTWLLGSPRRNLDPGIVARMTATSNNQVAVANSLRNEMLNAFHENPNLDRNTIRVIMEAKYANKLPGLTMTDLNVITPAAQLAKDMNGGFTPAPVSVPAGPLRDLWAIFPEEKFGTRPNGTGGVELEIPSGLTISFGDPDEAAQFIRDFHAVTDPRKNTPVRDPKAAAVAGAVLGPTPPGLPPAGSDAPAKPKKAPSGDAKVDIATTPSGSAVVTVTRGNVKRTRMFSSLEDAQVWAEDWANANAAPSPAPAKPQGSLSGRPVVNVGGNVAGSLFPGSVNKRNP